VLDGPYHPRNRGWESHVLTEDDLEPAMGLELRRRFFDGAGNLERVPLGRFVPLRGRGKSELSRWIAHLSKPFKRAPVRIAEKHIPNVLRIRFLNALFPDARFLHLTRDPFSNMTALYRAWNHPGRYKDFPLPDGFCIRGHEGRTWSFVLPQGWRSMDGRTLSEVCAFQWSACHRRCLADVATIDPARYLRIPFEDLVADPLSTLSRVAAWADLDPRPFRRLGGTLPRINLSKHVPDIPVPVEEIRAQLPNVREVAEALGYSND
jgi:Sulfotransferase family